MRWIARLCIIVIAVSSYAGPARAEMPPPVAATAQTIGFVNTPELALGPYIGLGRLKGSIESNNDVIGAQSSDGFIFYAGFPFNKWASLEVTVGSLGGLRVGATSDRSYPPSTAEYAFVAYGLKLNLAFERLHPFVPWIAMGPSAEMITWDKYVYSVTGDGSFVALGVDWYPAPRHSIRAEYRSHSFTGESDAYISDKYQVSTEMYAISYAFHFKSYGFPAPQR